MGITKRLQLRKFLEHPVQRLHIFLCDAGVNSVNRIEHVVHVRWRGHLANLNLLASELHFLKKRGNLGNQNIGSQNAATSWITGHE